MGVGTRSVRESRGALRRRCQTLRTTSSDYQRSKTHFRNSCCFGTSYTKLNKLALSSDDDKQAIQRDSVSTLAYGHKEASVTDVFRI